MAPAKGTLGRELMFLVIVSYDAAPYQGFILALILAILIMGRMAKVTGKYQITLPKSIVEQCDIRVGEELAVYAVGAHIHIHKTVRSPALSRKERLAHFDLATERQGRRKAKQRSGGETRGWTRDELYSRDRTR